PQCFSRRRRQWPILHCHARTRCRGRHHGGYARHASRTQRRLRQTPARLPPQTPQGEQRGTNETQKNACESDCSPNSARQTLAGTKGENQSFMKKSFLFLAGIIQVISLTTF